MNLHFSASSYSVRTTVKNQFRPSSYVDDSFVYFTHSKHVPVAKVAWMGRYYAARLQSFPVSISTLAHCCSCELIGHWQEFGRSAALTEWFPSGTTCQAESLPATLSYIPQCSGGCQLSQYGWVPPSAFIATANTWTSTQWRGGEERRGKGRDGQLLKCSGTKRQH